MSSDPLRSRLELRRRHTGRQENAVLLTVVLRPIGRPDSSVGLEPAKCRSAGHRYDHADGGDIDARIIQEFSRASEDPDVVLIESKHDPQVNRNLVAMQVCNQTAVTVDTVVSFV